MTYPCIITAMVSASAAKNEAGAVNAKAGAAKSQATIIMAWPRMITAMVSASTAKNEADAVFAKTDADKNSQATMPSSTKETTNQPEDTSLDIQSLPVSVDVSSLGVQSRPVYISDSSIGVQRPGLTSGKGVDRSLRRISEGS